MNLACLDEPCGIVYNKYDHKTITDLVAGHIYKNGKRCLLVACRHILAKCLGLGIDTNIYFGVDSKYELYFDK